MGFNLFNEVTMMTRLRTINRGMLEGMCYVCYAPPPPSTLDTFPYKSAPPQEVGAADSASTRKGEG